MKLSWIALYKHSDGKITGEEYKTEDEALDDVENIKAIRPDVKFLTIICIGYED